MGQPPSVHDRASGSLRRIVIVLDATDPDRLASFWGAVLEYRRSAAHEPYVVLVPDGSTGPELVLQRVPERKTTKNRMHLDLRVPDVDAEVTRLEALGATRITADPIDEGGIRWVVMTDPEGNEFCVGVEARPTLG